MTSASPPIVDGHAHALPDEAIRAFAPRSSSARTSPMAVREPSVSLDEVEKLGWGVAPWVKVDDADELQHSPKKARVPIVQPPSDGQLGRFFSFLDPDGYQITVHGSR